MKTAQTLILAASAVACGGSGPRSPSQAGMFHVCSSAELTEAPATPGGPPTLAESFEAAPWPLKALSPAPPDDAVTFAASDRLMVARFLASVPPGPGEALAYVCDDQGPAVVRYDAVKT